MSREPEAPRVFTWADFGIEIDELTFGNAEGKKDARSEAIVMCPKCNQYRLVLSRRTSTWHCDGCYWSGRLRVDGESGSGMVDLAEAAPMLERWQSGGLPPAIDCGVEEIDELYKPRRGEMTVITGHPGDGKSTWLKWYIIQVALRHGWNFAVFSPEDMPFHLYLGQMVVKIAGIPFDKIERRDLKMAESWAASHFTMMDPPDPTAEGLIAQLRIHAAKGYQGVIIDPWTEIEHAIPPGLREDQYLNRMLTKFRRLARLLHIHLFIVAHPKNLDRVHTGGGVKKMPVPTLDDLAGGAMWKNKTDWGMSIHRPNKGQGADDYIVDLHIQKARFSGFLGGRLGVERMEYVKDTGTYRDCAIGNGPLDSPLVAWKHQLNTRSAIQGYFDKEDWTWPIKDASAWRPIEWRGQRDGGWWHDAGRLHAFIDPGDAGWKATVMRVSDATSRRTTGPYAKPDEAFSWAERMLMEWELLPDPRGAHYSD